MNRTRLAFVFCVMALGLNTAHATSCDAAVFREVVAKASAAINELHSKNNAILQGGLQQLRGAKGWSDADFIAKAAPLIKDEVTASLDAKNQGLLAKVQTLQGGEAADSARCNAMAGELTGLMSQIVENTTARWQHMIAKVTTASNAPLHAGAAR